MTDEELKQIKHWTSDILTGIYADKDPVSLLHVDTMVRVIYQKGKIAGHKEGAEQTKAEIRKAATHYASGDPIEGGDAETLEGNEAYAERECYIVEASILAPKEEK